MINVEITYATGATATESGFYSLRQAQRRKEQIEATRKDVVRVRIVVC